MMSRAAGLGANPRSQVLEQGRHEVRDGTLDTCGAPDFAHSCRARCDRFGIKLARTMPFAAMPART